MLRGERLPFSCFGSCFLFVDLLGFWVLAKLGVAEGIDDLPAEVVLIGAAAPPLDRVAQLLILLFLVVIILER